MFIANYTEGLVQSIKGFYAEPLLWVPLLVFLAIATYTDIKERKIKNWLNLTFIGIRLVIIPFVGISWTDGLAAILGLLLLLVPAMIVMQQMGGDIKASFVLGLYLGLQWIPVFLLLSAIFLMATIFISFKSKRQFIFLPFAPFFLVSFILFFILTFFI